MALNPLALFPMPSTGTTSDISACSILKPLICTGPNAPADICNAITTCCVSETTTGLPQLLSSSCTKSITQITQDDIIKAATSIQTLAPAAINEFCSATAKNVKTINSSGDLPDNISNLFEWYYKTVTPAIVQTCGKSSSPIPIADMLTANANISKALCGGPTNILNLPKPVRYFLSYYKPIVGTIIGIFVLLFISVILLSIKLKTRSGGYQSQRTVNF